MAVLAAEVPVVEWSAVALAPVARVVAEVVALEAEAPAEVVQAGVVELLEVVACLVEAVPAVGAFPRAATA